MEKKTIGIKKILIIISVVLGLMVLEAFIIFAFFVKKDSAAIIPTLKIAQQKVELTEGEVVLPVTLSAMAEDELYPAASFSMTFDNTKLEFMGVDEGDVMVLADVNAQGSRLALPQWKANIAFANQSGRINIMYLDSTAGRYAFTHDGFNAESANTLFKLHFRLRGNVKAGDILDVLIQDAVIANSDEEKSMSMVARTLKVIDGRMIIIE